jgi:hypothetical protein
MKNILLPKIFQPFQCDDIIRLGKDHDGGYLVNYADVIKSKKLLSFGTGADISFERDFTRLNDVEVQSFDKTQSDDNISFYKEGRTHRYENIDKENIKSFLANSKDSFLKCDIDGGEYEILDYLISNSHKFTGAAIEFHDISQPHRFNQLTNFISKFGLRLVHTHINNYAYLVDEETQTYFVDVIELSFSSSRENTFFSNELELPHKFDTTNNPHDEEFRILF